MTLEVWGSQVAVRTQNGVKETLLETRKKVKLFGTESPLPHPTLTPNRERRTVEE